MSLINDVLRKMDQGTAGRRSEPVPENMSPPAEPGRGSSGRRIVAGLGLFLVGLIAGFAVWWGVAPPGQGSGGEVIPVEPTAKEPEPPDDEVGETGAEGSAREQEATESEPQTAKAREEEAESKGSEEESGSEEPGLPPMSEEMAEAAVAPISEDGSDSGDEAGPAKSKKESDPSPGEGSDFEVKEPADGPLKVALDPEGQGTAEANGEAGGGAEGASSRDGAASASAEGAVEENEGSESSGGEMEVQTPQGFRDRQEAGDLARVGFRALEAGQFDRAVDRLQRAHSLAPNRTDITNNLALAQWRAGQQGAAVQTLTGGVREHPDDARLARNLAHFLLRTRSGGREAGARALAEALEAQQSLALYALLGSVYRDMGHYRDAVSLYQTGIARNGPNWRLLLGLGMALEGRGQHQQAVQVYERAREQLPEEHDGVRTSIDERLQALAARTGSG